MCHPCISKQNPFIMTLDGRFEHTGADTEMPLHLNRSKLIPFLGPDDQFINPHHASLGTNYYLVTTPPAMTDWQ